MAKLTSQIVKLEEGPNLPAQWAMKCDHCDYQTPRFDRRALAEGPMYLHQRRKHGRMEW